MTGLHALHMVIGIGLVLRSCLPAWQVLILRSYYSPVENVGLYWQISVDLLIPAARLMSKKHGGA